MSGSTGGTVARRGAGWAPVAPGSGGAPPGNFGTVAGRAGEDLWGCQEGQMGQEMVRFGPLGAVKSRQDESIEVREVGRIRPSLGGTGGHVVWWGELICGLLLLGSPPFGFTRS
jgi:hypothetical protein